ncbi:MAG: nucleotide-binding universal stress UspA family protein [Natronomonas sp.]|jgi:nucleotide-binding universal stress UspA family protein
MFDTVVVATDGSKSAERAVTVALGLASRFDAAVHALYVVDAGEVAESPPEVREELEASLRAAGSEAVAFVDDHADTVTTAVREGDPATEVIDYAESVGADLVATGTRGRHGEHAFLLGSVAETVVRRAPMPALTVRQLADEG